MTTPLHLACAISTLALAVAPAPAADQRPGDSPSPSRQRPGDIHSSTKRDGGPAEKVVEAIRPALPLITVIEPRIWSCEFTSAALAQPMRFLVVLPPGATLTSAPLPAIYFLHGRGRHERTLLESDATRRRLLASPCAVVLPLGRDGWYVNSPAISGDRYADYVDEVVALAERHFPVRRTPQSRALGGWSMGGYGAVYTAARRAADFAAVASLIGLLDFPRPAIAEEGQNYTVPSRFGADPAQWLLYNPRRMVDRLRGLGVFLAIADQAFDRQMNEVFLADARAAGVEVEVLRLSGGHTFPMVEQALPVAFSFLERRLAPAAAMPGGGVAAGAAETAPPRHPAVGTKLAPADVDWEHPIYRSGFDDSAALRDWRLEGGKEMTVRDGRLVLASPPGTKTPADNRGHLVCWLTREVPADFLLEFSFRPQNRKQGLAIVFFNARGVAGQDIFDPGLQKRDGTFVQYLRGDLNNYHISYWAGDRGTANIRKNRGFHFVGVGDDLVAGAPADVFQKVRVYKRGGTIRLTVDDVIAAAYDDDGTTFGPVWAHSGWIGLRQMGHTVSGEYDHVAVWPLKR